MLALGAAIAESALSNFPRVHHAFVDFKKRAANAWSVHLLLLSALSAIAVPSTSTLQNLCTFLGRVPVLGAGMAESALSNFKRLS